MNFVAIIIAFLFGVLATLGMARLWKEYKRNINNLSSQVTELVDQVKEMQQAGPQRLPFKSRNEIENAIAAINYLYFDRKLENEAIENALAHLLKARNPDDEK